MKFTDFEYRAPRTREEVVRLLSERRGDSKILAGGQSLLPTMAYRMAQPAVLVDLKNVPDLAYVRVQADGVHIGARTRWRDIEDDPQLSAAHPLLKEAVKHIAHYQVRNRGTVGGSLAHADPASELPCVALTCGALLRVLGPQGERLIAAADFFTGPLSTVLGEDELILELQLPAWRAARRWAFQEFSRRRGDFAMAGIALHFDTGADQSLGEVRIGVFGAASVSHRLPGAEAALSGRVLSEHSIAAAVQAASDEVDPPSDIHASAAYRRALVGTLLRRCLLQAGASAAH